MIEAYAFLAAFTVQIVVASIISPARFIGYVRGWAVNFGSDRFAELYPGVDYDGWAARFVTIYRAANLVIAVVGVALMAWMFTVVRGPDWTRDVANLAVGYFMFQVSPMILLGLYALLRYRKLIGLRSTETKRTATLQRRGLFDFVSPAAVTVCAISFPLFVAYAVWLDLFVYDNATISRFCYQAIGAVTLAYAFNGFVIWKFLYGRKSPLVSQEGRAHTIGVTVKSSVYSSIAIAWFLSLFGTIGQPNLVDWRPFALSTFFIITTLLGFTGTTAPPGKTTPKNFGASHAA